jgi:hypothetical protein
MQKEERDLLEVLKLELEFLKAGGYGPSPRTAWRPRYIFEDSPACANYESRENPHPCTDCALIHLVPPESRSTKFPCRHIPLSASGETLDSLYRCSDQGEIEEVVGTWLRATIERLEAERVAAQRVPSRQSAAAGGMLKGTPLYQKQHPKCANPACPTAFHWTGGGKFLRFRPDPPAPVGESNPATNSPGGIHSVRHYWLCERCSRIFTLVYDDQCGVVLKALCPALPAASEGHKELSAA